jgi:competence protein ComEC
VSDRYVVALAACVAAGALAARPVPIALAAALLCAAGVVTRHQAHTKAILVIIGASLAASGLAARARDGLSPPAPSVIRGRWVTLLTDPAPYPGSVGVDIRIGRRHAQAFARGSAAESLAPRLAGEHVRVDGTLRPLTGPHRGWLVPRHIAARVSIDEVSGVRPANLIGRGANAYRRLVARGVTVLSPRLRPLFGGMVLGDDRGQTPELQDAFRAAGLTHLLVVSGENVAFALLIASPLIRRGRLGWRFVATLLVLGAFGVLTRWEPSVLRAEAMAAVAAAGALAGRPVPALRLLALAATGCLLLDPLLVHSVGFQLSMSACTGLVLLTPPLHRRRVPTLIAASIAAQVGAAVVLVPTFGTVPLVSLPANVLAVPVAGPLMMWGLTAGPVAGLVPGLATVIHLPTRVALEWEAGVATRAARIPLAPLGFGGCVALACGAGAVGLAVWLTRRRVVAFTMATVLAFVVLVAVTRAPQDGVVDIGQGAHLWVDRGHAVLAVGGRIPPDLLDALRARRIMELDVLVVTRPGSGAAQAAWPIVVAMHPRVVLAPEHHQLAGAHTARAGAVVAIGATEVRVTSAGPPLHVTVGRAVYRQARGPPAR